MKRLTALLLTLALMLALACPALAAESAKATTMRLATTEGTVTLSNANGRALTVRADMKLYSGYTVKTGEASYAYITLDDTKAIKLDASTTVEIRKSGKKLEVLVSAGKIFFNVTAPLEEDEEMEIRTSTIVTGIRGTAGVIDCVDDATSTLYLLDGEVTVRARDAGTGESLSIPVRGGQTAQISRTAQNAAPTASVRDIKTDEVPGFTLVELAKDETLQQKVAEQSGLDVGHMMEQATKVLVQDQKQAAEAQRRAEQAQAEAENRRTPAPIYSAPPPEVVSPPTPIPPPTPTPTPPPTPTPTPPPTPTTITLSGTVMEEQLLGALAGYSGVILAAGTTVNVNSGSLVIGQGKTLELKESAQLTVANGVEMDGVLLCAGTVTSNGTWTNTGVITLTGAGSLASNGVFTMVGGTVKEEGRTGNPTSVLDGSGSIVFNGGIFSSDKNETVIPTARFSSLARGVTPVRGIQTIEGVDFYLLGCGLSGLISVAGTDSLVIPVSETLGATTAISIAGGQNITLEFQTGGSLTLQTPIQNAGTLTLCSAQGGVSHQAQLSAQGCTAVVNSGTLNIAVAVSTTGNGHTVVESSGMLTVQEGAILAGGVGVKQTDVGAQMEMTGGQISGMAAGIDNEIAGMVSISGGWVRVVAQNAYGVIGPFTLTGESRIYAKGKEFLCFGTIPYGLVAEEEGDQGWLLRPVSTGGR